MSNKKIITVLFCLKRVSSQNKKFFSIYKDLRHDILKNYLKTWDEKEFNRFHWECWSNNLPKRCEWLLDRNIIDPSDSRNELLCWAAEYNHLEIVKRLLKDTRVNPSDRDNTLIYWVSGLGHKLIVKELLKDKRVAEARVNLINAAIARALNKGHLYIVAILRDHVAERTKKKQQFCA